MKSGTWKPKTGAFAYCGSKTAASASLVLNNVARINSVLIGTSLSRTNPHVKESAQQLVLDDRDEGDHLTLYITFQDGLRDAAHVGDSLRTRFRAETEVSIDKTVVEPFEEVIKRRGTDGELKDKKFIDNRPEQV